MLQQQQQLPGSRMAVPGLRPADERAAHTPTTRSVTPLRTKEVPFLHVSEPGATRAWILPLNGCPCHGACLSAAPLQDKWHVMRLPCHHQSGTWASDSAPVRPLRVARRGRAQELRREVQALLRVQRVQALRMVGWDPSGTLLEPFIQNPVTPSPQATASPSRSRALADSCNLLAGLVCW